ncbi:hypothetical protein HYC85_018595 [Camellia sinensis]|uniref:Uncharacterized protein n=1 Tax=Camellia sinensis TaxID=4442 RepID=A0A7J7GYL4_CAMSI|nr:hypothetical protein HYC85_018595 [Camellia sinensis]
MRVDGEELQRMRVREGISAGGPRVLNTRRTVHSKGLKFQITINARHTIEAGKRNDERKGKLVLLGIGEIIASRSCPKVLLLNGTHDRETSGFSAACFVTAIADALNRTYGDPHNCLKNHVSRLLVYVEDSNLPSQYINTLLVPKDGQIPIVAESLAAQGIFRVITVDSVRDPNVGVVFEPKSLIQALGASRCQGHLEPKRQGTRRGARLTKARRKL